MEVRFRNTEALYQLVYHAVSSGLRNREQIPAVKPGKEEKAAPVLPKVESRPEPFEAKRSQSTPIIAEPVKQEPVKPEPVKQVFVQESLFRKEEKKEEPPLVPKLISAPRRSEILELPKVEPLDFRKMAEEILPKEEPQKQISNIVQEENKYESKKIEPERNFLSEEARVHHRIIGQLFATYWLFEYEDQFYMLDQHAAHEKVLYERTMKRLAERQMESQNLMPPIILTLSAREEIALGELGSYLTQAGFEIEHFGGMEYQICAVPGNLYNINKKELFIEILDNLSELSGRNNPELILEKIASMSCKAAVKGNMKMSRLEMENLIKELLTLDNPYQCPHGRPTIISMSKYEIEKKFKRIV